MYDTFIKRPLKPSHIGAVSAARHKPDEIDEFSIQSWNVPVTVLDLQWNWTIGMPSYQTVCYVIYELIDRYTYTSLRGDKLYGYAFMLWMSLNFNTLGLQNRSSVRFVWVIMDHFQPRKNWPEYNHVFNLCVYTPIQLRLIHLFGPVHG